MSTPDNDAIPALAAALSLYLDELEGHRQVCIRHAPFADLRATRSGTLHVTRRYRLPGDADRHIVDHLRRFFRSADTAPESACRPRPMLRLPAGSELLRERWISWTGIPLFIVVARSRRTLTTAVAAPSSPRDLPALPLCRVANILACHEALVPMLWVEPIRLRKKGGTLWPIPSLLLRAMRHCSVLPASMFANWPDG